MHRIQTQLLFFPHESQPASQLPELLGSTIYFQGIRHTMARILLGAFACTVLLAAGVYPAPIRVCIRKHSHTIVLWYGVNRVCASLSGTSVFEFDAVG